MKTSQAAEVMFIYLLRLANNAPPNPCVHLTKLLVALIVWFAPLEVILLSVMIAVKRFTGNAKTDILQQVEKAMGLKAGEKVVRIHTIKITNVCREPLRRMVDEAWYGRHEVILEGFPLSTPQEFVDLYCRANKCKPDTIVTRIEFEYLD